MNNERFPHWCKIYRETETNPYDDENREKRCCTRGSAGIIPAT